MNFFDSEMEEFGKVGYVERDRNTFDSDDDYEGERDFDMPEGVDCAQQ